MAGSMNSGIVYATLAFVTWGLFPLYLRQVATVPPLEVVLHRSTWSLLFVLLLLAALQRFAWMRAVLRQPRLLAMFMLSALLLSCNWLVYVFAVQRGHVVEASLGYFINPIVNVLLGVLVLHERLNRVQWTAVALAALGVLWLTLLAGRPPWIALVLALSFGFYGLMRKTSTLGALEGLALETLLLAPLVLPLLAWWTFSGQGAMARGDLALNAWLLLGGPLTALSCGSPPAHAACRWPRWACCSICRRRCNWHWGYGCSMSPSTAKSWWASSSSGPRWRSTRWTAGGAAAWRRRRPETRAGNWRMVRCAAQHPSIEGQARPPALGLRAIKGFRRACRLGWPRVFVHTGNA